MKKRPSPEDAREMPDSLFQLIKSIFTGIIRNFPRVILRMLIISVVSFAVVMAVNFYVIAVVNNGDQKPMDPNSPWYYLANLGNNSGSFTAISFLFFFLLSSVIEMILDKGFLSFIKDIVVIPKWTFNCFKNGGMYRLPALFTSMGLSMFIYISTQNKFLYITCILILLTIYMTRENNFPGILIHVIWQDIQRIFMRKKKARGTNIHLVSIVILGFMSGILILYVLPYKSLSFVLGKVGDYFPLVLALILFVTSFLLIKKKISPKAAVFLVVFAFVNLMLSKLISETLAHDGGWREGGSNWNSYINSAGSARVISLGRKPGLFASAGAWLGNLLYNGYSYTADAAVGTWNYTTEKYDQAVNVAMHGFLAWEEAYDSSMQYMSERWDETSKYFTDKWNGACEYVTEQFNYALSYMENAASFIKQDIVEAASTIYDAVTGTAEYIKDLAVNLYENPAIFWETVKESASTVADAFYESCSYTADLAKNLLENPAIFGEFFKQSWDITKNMAGSVYDTVTSPAKLLEFAKDLVGYNNFVNSIDPNRSLLSRLGQTTLGVAKLGATLYTVSKTAGAIKNSTSKLLGLTDDAAKVVVKPTPTVPNTVKPPVTPKPPVVPKPVVPSTPPATPITAPLKIDLNKINHIFGPNKIVGHKLEPFAKLFNNDMTKAFDSLQKATLEYINKNGITGVFKDVVVRANGVDITVRGSVVNGVMKLGTAFVP